MAALVIPFAHPKYRRVRLTATAPQRAQLESFMTELQLLILEHPNAFAHLVRQTHAFAEPIRKRLAKNIS